MNVTLLSDDRVYVRLLAQNLARRGHLTFVSALSQMELQRLVDKVASDKAALLIFDLGWFDPGRQDVYQALGFVCASTAAPRIVIADARWPEAWLKRFEAQQVLRKPFPMEKFLRVVEAVSSVKTE